MFNNMFSGGVPKKVKDFFNSIQSSASKINATTKEERDIPTGFDNSLLTSFRVWKLLGERRFETNIKAERLYSDLEADAIYYVDGVNGLDTNDGSSETPFKTIYAGVRAGATGQKTTVYVKAGTYTDANGWNGSAIVPDELQVIGVGGIVISRQTVGTSANGRQRYSDKVYLENIIFDGGKQSYIVEDYLDNENKLICKNVGFINSASDNGLSLEGNGLYILENCIARNNYLDGFNYHNGATVKNQLVIEINCKGYNNGVGTGKANNGSTMHDGGKIIRINGEYYGNGNRNVHDINDCHSWNLGCNAYDGAEDGEGNFVIGSEAVAEDTSKMWLDTCTTGGNTLYDVKLGSANNGSATIYTYDLDSGDCLSGDTTTPYNY